MSRHVARICRVILVALCVSSTARSADFSAGFHFGYKGGVSIGASGMLSDFAQHFPFATEFGITFSMIDPGDPFPARRVFIANATNGTPEKSGRTWDLKLDFLYNLQLPGPKATYLYAGVRYSMFDASFHYVGANEEFDVTSNQWGLGLGARGLFAISNHVSFMMSAGAVGYFKGALHGHDTTYSPDDQNVNPKERFTYKDAANVIYTPRLQPEVLLGMTYSW